MERPVLPERSAPRTGRSSRPAELGDSGKRPRRLVSPRFNAPRKSPWRGPGRAAVATLAFLLPACSERPAATQEPANVVLILVDDLGWMDLGCQGANLYETPRIDGLAAAGVRFAQAYANCPVCSPSRAALLSGHYPARIGFTGHITAIGRHRYPEDGAIVPPRDFMHLRDEVVTVAEALGAAGYVSASVGKWHLGGEGHGPRDQGFDVNIAGHIHGSPPTYFFPYRKPQQAWNPDIPNLDLATGADDEYLTDRLTAEAVRFIETNRNRPFFLYLSHYAVHTPLEAPEPLVRKYAARVDSDTPPERAVYAAMVETVDRSVGRVLDALDALGLADRTVVILTSDNGGLEPATDNAPLRAGKGHLYEGGIRVPLIVRWPGRAEPGAVVERPVTAADLYPFLTHVAGLDPERFPVPDGRNLAALLEAGTQAWEPRDLIWYYPHYSPQARRPGAAILTGGYKLIEFYDPPAVELYRLADDLGEERDLAERMPELAAELQGKLNSWLAANAPIRHGPNPRQEGSSP